MRLVLKILLGVIAAILLLPMVLDRTISSIVIALVLGWFSFLQRTLPKLTWNWDLIGMALVSTTIILFFAHKFLNGLSKSIASKRGLNWIWPWTWTWSLFVAVLLLFLVGMAVGGATHQVGWIASSPEPLFEKKPFYFTALNDMKQIDLAFRLALEDAGGNLAKVREELWKPKSDYFGNYAASPPMLQKYHLFVVVDGNNTALGAIIFPRDLKTRERSGGICSLDAEDDSYPKSSKLSELLKKYQARLIAL